MRARFGPMNNCRAGPSRPPRRSKKRALGEPSRRDRQRDRAPNIYIVRLAGGASTADNGAQRACRAPWTRISDGTITRWSQLWSRVGCLHIIHSRPVPPLPESRSGVMDCKLVKTRDVPSTSFVEVWFGPLDVRVGFVDPSVCRMRRVYPVVDLNSHWCRGFFSFGIVTRYAS